MKITASYALLLGTVAALLLMLAPGDAKAQAAVDTPANLTATPRLGVVYLEWTPPPAAEYHFVAWLPVGTNPADAQIRPFGAAGQAVITGLLPEQTYHFAVIAGRWEWSPANYGPKWSGWTQWVTTTPAGYPPSLPADDGIASSSASASHTVKLTLTIGNLPMNMAAGSSIELYLEDDFKVPDSIDPGNVYFAVTNPWTTATNAGGRVYTADPIAIANADHYGGDDDWAVRVFLPDMNTAEGFDGFQGPMAGHTLQLVILKSGGIKNPIEAGTHSVGYSVLRPNAAANAGPQVQVGTVATVAKIHISDHANTRGYALTVTGAGFNNETSAAVHVLHAVDPYPAWWDSTTCAEMNAIVGQSGGSADAEGYGYCQPWARLNATQQAKVRSVPLRRGGPAEATFCRHIIREGHRAGIARVGSDHRVAVTFEVTVPIFGPGNTNYLCMIDGEGRSSETDVEVFTLEPSIRVSPTSASVGDTITVSAQDYPNPGANFTSLEIANRVVFWSGNTPGERVNIVKVSADAISPDGSATATFELPDSVSGIPLEGAIRIYATWGNVSEDANIILTGSTTLGLSIGEARANESVTIRGADFGALSGNYIDPANITIDGVPLLVDNYSLTDYGRVAVSRRGQFEALVHLWNAAGDNNPALTPGAHTIRVVDNAGFYGTATIVIKDPSLTILPSRADPEYPIYATIMGSDWPVNNWDSDADVGYVTVVVADRQYKVIPDSTGRFVVEDGGVRPRSGIPSTNQVKATYGDSGAIVKVTNLEVPDPVIDINPPEQYPGAAVTLSVTGMPIYTAVDEITISIARVGSSLNLHTDRYGAVTATVPVPGLDPGAYPVVVRVGAGVNKTVAIGYLTVVY